MSTASANWLPRGWPGHHPALLRLGAWLAHLLTLRSWVVRRLLKRLDPANDSWVIDVGCGTGEQLKQLGRRWPTAYLLGLDADPHALAVAGRMGLSPNTQLRPADAAHPPPEAAHAQCVLMISVLQYVPEAPQVLARWAAAVPPGCRLVLYVPVGQRRRLPGWHALMRPLRHYDYDAALGGAHVLPATTWQYILNAAGWHLCSQGYAYGPGGQWYYDLWALTVALTKASPGALKVVPLALGCAQLPLWWVLMSLDYLWPPRQGNGWWAVLTR